MIATISQTNTQESTQSIELETELLLSCARSQVNSELSSYIITLLKQDIDWQYLLELSRRHKVLPLIYANLSNIESSTVDNPIHHNFHKIFQANIQRNLLLTSELLKVLNFLQNNGVKAIPFKGVVLARLAYRNFGLRSVSDLDIIVKPEDFAKTQKLLIQYGYKASPINKEAYYQQCQYYKPNGLVGIDLHYEFAPKNHFVEVDSSLFWDNLETLTIANQQISIFSLDCTIIHLCLEGAKENWRFLSRICDLAELISSQQINWQSLLKTANAIDKRETVFLGLYLIHTIFETPIPEDIWQEINKTLIVKLSRNTMCDFLFRRQFSLLVAVKWYLFNLQVFQSFSDKLKYLSQVIKVNIKVNFMKKLKQ